MPPNTPSPGSPRSALDTPCLIIDLDALDRNIAFVAAFCRDHRLVWRPHAKSYKSSELARRVVAGGAIGVTCSKLAEAEVMSRAGIRDLLITVPVVGRSKLRRLVELRQLADPIAVVDHPDHVHAISNAIAPSGLRMRVMIEVDVGLQRCGVAPGEAAVALGRLIASLPGLELAGIMGWEGHLLLIDDPDEKSQRIRAAINLLGQTRAAFLAAGLRCPIVSAGGTGSFQITGTLGVIDELQAGGAVLMDLFYRQRCKIAELEFALTVLATVISRPTPHRVVIDVGRKTVNPELQLPAVRGRDDLRVQWLSAEHGVLEVLHGYGPAIGERLELIPGYGDWTTVLHDRYFVFRGDRLETIWPLDARGCSG